MVAGHDHAEGVLPFARHKLLAQVEQGIGDALAHRVVGEVEQLFFLLAQVVRQHLDEAVGHIAVVVHEREEVLLGDDEDFRVFHRHGRLFVSGIAEQGQVAHEVAALVEAGDIFLGVFVGLVGADAAIVDQEQAVGVAAFVEDDLLGLVNAGLPLIGEVLEGLEAPHLLDKAADALGIAPKVALERLMLAQAHLDGVEQLYIVEGLGDVIIGPEVHAFAEVGGLGLGGEEDKRNGSRVGIFAQHPQHPKAVELRHHDITDDEVGPRLLGEGYALFPIGGGKHLVIGQFQYFGRILPHIGIVFYEEDGLHCVR